MPTRWCDIPISSSNSVASETASNSNDVQGAVAVSREQLQSHEHELPNNSCAGSCRSVRAIGEEEAQLAVACKITDCICRYPRIAKKWKLYLASTGLEKQGLPPFVPYRYLVAFWKIALDEVERHYILARSVTLAIIRHQSTAQKWRWFVSLLKLESQALPRYVDCEALQIFLLLCQHDGVI